MLTQVQDPTADVVCHMLNDRGVEFVRCDPGDFPSRASLCARLDGAGWTGVLRCETGSVALEDIRSVYYRRPSVFDFPPELSEPERRFAAAQARHAVSGVLAGLRGVRWVNRPAAMADARVKPYQLAVAAGCGLRTPDTLLTNDPASVPSFGRETGGRLITKPLARSIVTEGGQTGLLYTSEVPSPQWDNPAIATTAHLFQPFVAGLDVRLAMVEDAAFAATITPHDPAGPIDIRAHDDVTYTVIDVPDPVRLACRKMLDALQLTFGAFDFRLDDGTWTLLELNPNGQWAFIPDLQAPIGSALTDALTPER